MNNTIPRKNEEDGNEAHDARRGAATHPVVFAGGLSPVLTRVCSGVQTIVSYPQVRPGNATPAGLHLQSLSCASRPDRDSFSFSSEEKRSYPTCTSTKTDRVRSKGLGITNKAELAWADSRFSNRAQTWKRLNARVPPACSISRPDQMRNCCRSHHVMGIRNMRLPPVV